MTPTIVKAADAAQFLAVVPRMLGFQPKSSLVVIPFEGSRSLGAMRFDLPGDAEGETVDRISATVIGMVCRVPSADGIAGVIYTDARFAEDGGMPHRALLDALERRAHACGLRLSDMLCVAGDGWGSLLDAECPPEGRGLDELEDGALALPGVPAPDGDQASGAELPACSPEQRDRVTRAYEALERAVAVLCGPDDSATGTATRTSRSADAARLAHASAPGSASTPRSTSGSGSGSGSATMHAADLAPVPPPIGDDGVAPDAGGPGDADDAEDEASVAGSFGRFDPRALATVCRLDDVPGFFEDTITGRTAPRDAYDLAALIWCLARPSLRDVALVQWSGTFAQGDEAFAAQLRWEAGEEYPGHLAMRMWGEGETPDIPRLKAALELAREAAAAAPRVAQAGALSLCAWLAWALGRSTHAAAYAERACEIEPEHGLSQIVLSFVHAGHLPDWAFRRSSVE